MHTAAAPAAGSAPPRPEPRMPGQRSRPAVGLPAWPVPRCGHPAQPAGRGTARRSGSRERWAVGAGVRRVAGRQGPPVQWPQPARPRAGRQPSEARRPRGLEGAPRPAQPWWAQARAQAPAPVQPKAVRREWARRQALARGGPGLWAAGAAPCPGFEPRRAERRRLRRRRGGGGAVEAMLDAAPSRAGKHTHAGVPGTPRSCRGARLQQNSLHPRVQAATTHTQTMSLSWIAMAPMLRRRRNADLIAEA